MKTANYKTKVNKRRVGALERLQETLKVGLKTSKGQDPMKTESITDNDKKRIEKEIANLQSKVTTTNVAQGTRTKKYRGGAGVNGR